MKETEGTDMKTDIYDDLKKANEYLDAADRARFAAEAQVKQLTDALVTMAKCWTGNSFSPPDYYMGHGETCGGKGNDRACSCASNQSRGAFKRGREAITAALKGGTS